MLRLKMRSGFTIIQTQIILDFTFDGSANSLYKLPDAYPGLATSTLVCDSTGTMSWVRPKRSYVLSFGAGFTPTANAADSIQLNLPYAPDGTSLNYVMQNFI